MSHPGPRLAARQLPMALLVTLTALLPLATGWQGLDRLFYDRLLRHLQPAVTVDNILLITIDQRSLDLLGRWPWRRARHAELVQILTAAQARVIALDILFAEPDLERPQDDQRLAAAIQAHGKVVLPLVVEQSSTGGALRETLPLSSLVDAAAALGHADAEIDSDGIVRSVFLKAGLGKPTWPALALAMAQIGAPPLENKQLPGERNQDTNSGRGDWVRDYRVLVPYSGPPGTISRVSFADVLEKRIPQSTFSDKYVLIGTTASGIGEKLATPVSIHGQAMSGVEFNAQLLAGLLNQRLIVKPEWWIVAGLNLAFAVVGILLFLTLGSRRLLPALLLLATLLLALCYSLVTYLQLWFPPAGAMIALLLGFAIFARQRLIGLLRALFAERDSTEQLLASIGDAIIRTDSQGCIQHMNEAAQQLSGFHADEVRGRAFDTVLSLRERSDNKPFPLERLLSQRLFHSNEPLVMTSLRGQKVPVQIAATPLAAGEHGSHGVLIAISDISQEEKLQAAITHRENHDPLTQLPNRAHLLYKLRCAVRRVRLSGRFLILLELDMERLQQINERLGSTAGDQLLQTIAERLTTMESIGKIVGRVGGDEFVLAVESNEGADAATQTGERVQQLITAEIDIQGQMLRPAARLGISVFPELADSAEELLRQANAALHQAKTEQDADFVLFSDSMRSELEHRRQIQQALDTALREERLETFYLPLVRAEDGVIRGVESLLRLPDGDGGYLPAHAFIALAEQRNILAEIGYRQFTEICYQQKQWQQAGLPPLRMAFNLSSSQLRDPALSSMLSQIMRSTGIHPALVEFEIGEPVLLEQEVSCLPALQSLRNLGCSICLDDFGTSSGAMSTLMQFNFQRLKIDPLFVHEIGNRSGSGAITSAMIGMARSLDMQVTAEGIEHAGQFETLKQQGCDELQGFYFGEPLPAELFLRYYQDNQGVARGQPAANGELH